MSSSWVNVDTLQKQKRALREEPRVDSIAIINTTKFVTWPSNISAITRTQQSDTKGDDKLVKRRPQHTVDFECVVHNYFACVIRSFTWDFSLSLVSSFPFHHVGSTSRLHSMKAKRIEMC